MYFRVLKVECFATSMTLCNQLYLSFKVSLYMAQKLKYHEELLCHMTGNSSLHKWLPQWVLGWLHTETQAMQDTQQRAGQKTTSHCFKYKHIQWDTGQHSTAQGQICSSLHNTQFEMQFATPMWCGQSPQCYPQKGWQRVSTIKECCMTLIIEMLKKCGFWVILK